MAGPDLPADENYFTEWLADHPRFAGALFATLVLLSKAGAAAVSPSSATNGP